jgi:spermidine/putrescine transport system permease protein
MATYRPFARGTLNTSQRGALLTLPIGLIVLGLLFYAPLFGLLVQSLGPSGPNLTGEAPLGTYAKLLGQSSFWLVVQNSFFIAGLAFAIMLVVGYPLAFLLAFRIRRGRLLVLLALVLTGSVSDIVRIFAWRTILGSSGIVNGVLTQLGIIREPLGFLLFSPFAVVVVLAAGWLPFVVIPIYAAMRTIDPATIDVARDLYATPADVIRHVVFPLSFPGILGAFVIVFVPLLTEFATPQMVGGPRSLMLGNIVSDQILGLSNWPVGAAAATMLLLLAVLLIGAAQLVSRHIYGR